jgi:hypothetical protein
MNIKPFRTECPLPFLRVTAYAYGIEVRIKAGALRVGVYQGWIPNWFCCGTDHFFNIPPGSWHLRLWRIGVDWQQKPEGNQ